MCRLDSKKIFLSWQNLDGLSFLKRLMKCWVRYLEENSGFLIYNNENINLYFDWLPGSSFGSEFNLWIGMVTSFIAMSS